MGDPWATNRKLTLIHGGDRERRLAMLTAEAARRNARVALGREGVRIALRYGHTTCLAIPEPDTSQLPWIADALDLAQDCIVSTDADPDELARQLRSFRPTVPTPQLIGVSAS